MAKFIVDILKRFTSRKFLLTLFGIAAITQKPDMAGEIVTLVGLFVGAEGAKDTVAAYANDKFVQPQKMQQDQMLKISAIAAGDTGQSDDDTIQPGFNH